MDESMDRNDSDSDTKAEGVTADVTYGQRRVRDALQALDVPAPDTLRRAVERDVAAALEPRSLHRRVGALAGGARPDGSRRAAARARPFAFAAAGLTALVVALALVFSGSDGAPTVQQASRLALRPAAAPPPPVRPGTELLQASVDGIAYPTWTRAGWRVVGERRDTLAGHAIRTVLYVDRSGGRVGYAIAAGDALPVTGGRVVERRGARLRLLAVDGAAVVTWRRDGHTCILASREVAAGRLLTLASYAT